MLFSVPTIVQDLMTGYVDSVWRGVQGVTGQVIIYKEPIKNIIINPSVNIFGYENESSSKEEITYIPVSQIFGGQAIYPRKQKGNNPYFDDKFRLENNSVYLRCKQDCRDYIKNGEKTVNLQLDGKYWNLGEGEQIQNFMNLKYYYFEIIATN